VPSAGLGGGHEPSVSSAVGLVGASLRPPRSRNPRPVAHVAPWDRAVGRPPQACGTAELATAFGSLCGPRCGVQSGSSPDGTVTPEATPAVVPLVAQAVSSTSIAPGGCKSSAEEAAAGMLLCRRCRSAARGRRALSEDLRFARRDAECWATSSSPSQRSEHPMGTRSRNRIARGRRPLTSAHTSGRDRSKVEHEPVLPSAFFSLRPNATDCGEGLGLLVLTAGAMRWFFGRHLTGLVTAPLFD
jgi:hypothetical protein